MPLTRWSLKSAVLTIGLLFSAQHHANELPDLGASALTVLSIEKEKRLGSLMYSELRGQAAVLYDPLVDEYLNSLGNRLVAHANDVNFPFTFFTVNSPEINAFAFYGGHIGTHTGLITAAETESQLASVLAHEIAHVTQRHLARRQQAANQSTPLTLAGIVGSILLAAINPEAMIAGVMATQAGAQQNMINYTRHNEMEADNIGMNTLANAGFDPAAAAQFFAKLQDEFRYKSRYPAFLLTHPLPDSRVTDARLRAHQYEKRFYTDSLEFLLTKARIKARWTYDKEEAIGLFEQEVKNSHGNRLFASQYGLALAYLDNNKLEQAERLLLKLEELAPDNLYLLDTFSDLYIAKKTPEVAQQKLAQAYQLRPNNAVVTLNYANVAIENKQPEKAIQLLEYYLLEKPNSYLATQILREAYKQAKNMAKYHSTGAELYALISQYRQAIKSADLALAQLGVDDRAEVSRLEALKIQYRQKLSYVEKLKGKAR